ncbi:hypothetical protein [Zeimonas arvi]|uniref:Uncharacterized protein n=1 Tax=Zeimonas arvi TaxID=2498847 RepID=A0A5C8NX31_9BURK|nr:hypothetical protein [Zeimonas arvi]TXL65572.1 hypothetical protein FHP08_12415 [Zeimonas arvi]
MQIFDPSMRLRTGKASGARGILLLPIAASLVLAGCGGGSSIGDVTPQPVVRCTALDGGGSGFSLGVCTNPATLVASSAFQPIEAAVLPGANSSYALTLNAPAKILNVAFGSGDETDPGVRDIIGAVRGTAYEKDADPSDPISSILPVPPYTALVDFRNAWDADVGTEVLRLEFVNFGYWEQFTDKTADGGFFGGWYSKRSETSVTNDRPSGQTAYSGFAVGVLSPAEPGARSYGFSATVNVVGDNNGVQSGEIKSMKISYRDSANKLIILDVPLNDLVFAVPVNDLAGQAATTDLLVSTGSEVVPVGRVEARFFGSATSRGAEVAGRLRFQTADGMRGVGAFGARAVSGG